MSNSDIYSWRHLKKYYSSNITVISNSDGCATSHHTSLAIYCSPNWTVPFFRLAMVNYPKNLIPSESAWNERFGFMAVQSRRDVIVIGGYRHDVLFFKKTAYKRPNAKCKRWNCGWNDFKKNLGHSTKSGRGSLGFAKDCCDVPCHHRAENGIFHQHDRVRCETVEALVGQLLSGDLLMNIGWVYLAKSVHFNEILWNRNNEQHEFWTQHLAHDLGDVEDTFTPHLLVLFEGDQCITSSLIISSWWCLDPKYIDTTPQTRWKSRYPPTKMMEFNIFHFFPNIFLCVKMMAKWH